MAPKIASFNPDPDAPVSIDYVIPASGQISMTGNWARRLLENNMDVGCMRPYIHNSRSYITRNYYAGRDDKGNIKTSQKAILTYNDANATLGYNDWLEIDRTVVEAAKPALEMTQELRRRGLTYNLPNGIGKTLLQYQSVSDISPAVISMDGLRESESDRPVFATYQFPIPLIHKDFQFSLREVMESRNGTVPLDTYTASLAARKVGEGIEQLVLGVDPNTSFPSYAQLQGVKTYKWANQSINGLLNTPTRITYGLTLPTAGGWTPQTTVDDILIMKRTAQFSMHPGPYLVLCGMYWDPYMDEDYKSTYNDMTLRERIKKIDKIEDVRTVSFIPDTSIVLVQMTVEVIRLVIGLDVTTVQWESHGGMQLNFKIIACMVPQLRTDFYGTSGIVHGS